MPVSRGLFFDPYKAGRSIPVRVSRVAAGNGSPNASPVRTSISNEHALVRVMGKMTAGAIGDGGGRIRQRLDCLEC
jgi:hypothetical protein